ncbi:MAG TPA: heavy metal translocating P-type ATPase metal-binding domain-containing protein, partial [Terriglobales bacterium]|nr:heavy metal translocating P-type ATPase metal-binding domain-containing protein [Terriglobales bacterium]
MAPAPGAGFAGLELKHFVPASPPDEEAIACFHCGEPCPDETPKHSGKHFCCQGCLAVHEILAASGLERFYDLADTPGVKVGADAQPEKWAYLDTPAAQQQLLDFTDGQQSRVTLQIPAIHCVACVWLLENLFKLHPGIGESRVNFARRELAVKFEPGKISLGGLVSLLSSLGYEPQFTLGQQKSQGASVEGRRRWLQLGVAGFAFGNIMLFSIPLYLGLDSFSGPAFRSLFGYVSLMLAVPVLLYSASDYWKGAAQAARHRVLSLDVPIALGLA